MAVIYVCKQAHILSVPKCVEEDEDAMQNYLNHDGGYGATSHD